MNYVLALFLPTLAMIFTGRWILGVLLTLPWVVLSVLSSGIAHGAFVVIAWILIFQARADQRNRDLIEAVRQSKGD